jgi:hypothetical protein
MLEFKPYVTTNFDAILKAAEKATYRNLTQFGAITRRDAQRSMRKAGKKGTPSKPGKPPKARSGYLKRNIFFEVERDNNNVVIGPILKRRGFSNVPEALEYGKLMRYRGSSKFDDWHRRLKMKRKVIMLAKKPYMLEARPYMRPARDRVLKTIGSIWANSIKP